jgi:hypothetical protein
MKESGDDTICQMQMLVDTLIRVVLVPGNFDLGAKGSRFIAIPFKEILKTEEDQEGEEE